MNDTSRNTFPKPGTALTYADAFKAYRELEDYMLSRVYIPSFRNNVNVYDLMLHLEELASKYGIVRKRRLGALRRLVHQFVSEQTALANGDGGTRFYLHGDTKALSKYDETHLFEIGIDGEALRREFDGLIEQLDKESAGIDEFADTYSPHAPSEAKRKSQQDDYQLKWLTICICILLVCVGLSMLLNSFFQIGICSRWFI